MVRVEGSGTADTSETASSSFPDWVFPPVAVKVNVSVALPAVPTTESGVQINGLPIAPAVPLLEPTMLPPKNRFNPWDPAPRDGKGGKTRRENGTSLISEDGLETWTR
jgi:hypothetical protein